MKHALFDRALELIVMRDNQPIWIAGGGKEFFGYPLIGSPYLHCIIINDVADAKYLGARIGGVTPSADVRQIERAAHFDIPEENRHDARLKRETKRGGSP